jgi:large subunit ribosomal protein L13
VVIVNADKIQLTGDKLDQKVYYRHSGRPGSLKSETARERLDKYPERVIQAAVWGMLPKNRLGRKLLRKLKVYSGPEHPHEAQQPQTHTL